MTPQVRTRPKRSKSSAKALNDYIAMVDRAGDLLFAELAADERLSLAPDPDAIEKAARAYVAEKWPGVATNVARTTVCVRLLTERAGFTTEQTEAMEALLTHTFNELIALHARAGFLAGMAHITNWEQQMKAGD